MSKPLAASVMIASVLLMTLVLLGCLPAAPADAPGPQHPRIEPVPVAEDPDALVRSHMMAGWRDPPRRKWTIAYHPIDGLDDASAWHLQGTMWWVRLVSRGDPLDEHKIYEIDAAALNQNYGTIDFYVYDRRELGDAPPPADR